MNMHRVAFIAAALAAFFVSANGVVAEIVRRDSQVAAPSATTETVTVTVTIIKLDAAARTVSVRDKDQKIWDFVVAPEAGIDLARYKVGDIVTATITITTEPPANPQTRARISKQELIKLQKK
jgi:hypothetical protein